MARSFLLAIALLPLLAAAGLPAKPLWFVAGDPAMQALVLNADARRDYYVHTRIWRQPASVLAECSTLLLAPGGALEATEEQVRAFLEGGGNLVIVGRVAREALTQWPGLFGPAARYGGVPGPGTVFARHPLLPQPKADLALDIEVAVGLEKDTSEEWPELPFADGIADPEGGEAPIRNGSTAILWIKQVGRGKLVFIPDNLLPARLKDDHRRFAIVSNDAFHRRLFDFLGVPKLADVVAMTPAVWWYREPGGHLEGARNLLPPVPQPGEQLARLELLAGLDECERRPVYLSLPRLPARLTASVDGLAPGRFRIGLQDEPMPGYRGSLVYVRWLEPGEVFRPTLSALTLWVEVDTTGLGPGQHAATLQVGFDGEAATLPLAIEVAPVRLPWDRRFVVDYEFFINNLLYPYAYRDTWPDHWQRLGIDVLLAGMPPFPDVAPVLKLTSGGSLVEAVTSAPEPLRDRLPPIDFGGICGGRFDLLVQAAVAHRVVYFRTYMAFGLQRTSFVPLTRLLYRDESLEADAEEVSAVITAFMRQAGDFLAAKGCKGYYSKTMDEWLADGVEPWLSLAEPIAAGGWGNVANPNLPAVLAVPELRQRIWPYLTQLWIAGKPADWHRMEAEAPPLTHPGGFPAGHSTMATSSYWWDGALLDGPRLAWAAAARRRAGFHLHGWGTRGKYSGEGALASPDCTRMYPNQSMAAMTDAFENTRYAILFLEMTDELARHQATAPLARNLLARWERIVAPGTDALLPIEGERVAKDGLTLTRLAEARRRLFELMAEAVAALPAIPPTLTWHRVTLIRDGQPVLPVVADAGCEAAAASLRELLAARTGIAPVVGSELRSPSLILANYRADTQLSREAARRFPHAITPSCPAPGAYLLLADPDGSLWILADSPATHRTAVANLLHGCQLTPRWFSPAADYQPGQ